MKNEDMHYIYDDDDEEYITDEQMETIKAKCKELLDQNTSPKYLVGCIYGLYENYIISEEQESELYQFVDPHELYNETSDYWWAIEGDNELAKCIGYKCTN